MAALYFPHTQNNNKLNLKKCDDDRESGNGSSPQSPSNSLDTSKLNIEFDNKMKATDLSLNFVSLSLCGGLDKNDGGPTEEEFNANIVHYSDICQNPSIFASKNLVVRINNKFYSWIVACPYIMTLIAFQKELPHEVCDKIMSDSKPKSHVDQKEDEGPIESSRRSWFLWRRSGGTSESERVSDKKISPTQNSNIEENILKSSDNLNYSLDKSGETSSEIYRKTLRLDSKQIQSLNLKNGINEIEFSVTTAYQGTSRCKCFLFKWKYNDKVVISDIDGTITRSDVLGHILPMVSSQML